MSYSGSLVFLFVTDLEVLIDQGSCRILGADEMLMVGLCGERAPSPDGVILTLVTDRVEELCAVLASNGVVFEQEPRYSPEYDITHAFLRDPDGYLVEIQRFESI